MWPTPSAAPANGDKFLTLTPYACPLLKIQSQLLLIDRNLSNPRALCVPLTWLSHDCEPPVILCVLRLIAKDETLLPLHPEKVMTITLEFTGGHLCRAGKAPWNGSLSRRGLIIPFRFIVVRETWTEPGRGAGGEQQEGKGWVLWVHENAHTWAFGGSQWVGSWRGEWTAPRDHYFCAQNSGQTRDPCLSCSWWSLVDVAVSLLLGPSYFQSSIPPPRITLSLQDAAVALGTYEPWGGGWGGGWGGAGHTKGYNFGLGYPRRNACLTYLRASPASHIFCGPNVGPPASAQHFLQIPWRSPHSPLGSTVSPTPTFHQQEAKPSEVK